VLARLNLLAYARNDSAFTYIRENDQLAQAGSILCTEARPGRYPPPEVPDNFGPDDRCAAFDFQLGPRTELAPIMFDEANEAARARLAAAHAHYRTAVRLDATNLRARLGYAYTLDRLGRTSAARRELRTIIKRGLPRLAGEQPQRSQSRSAPTYAARCKSADRLRDANRGAAVRSPVRADDQHRLAGLIRFRRHWRRTRSRLADERGRLAGVGPGMARRDPLRLRYDR
jgi:hypothetical protein